MILKFFNFLVTPKSETDDSKRRELILNILLVLTLFLLLSATILKIIFDGFFAPTAPGSLPLIILVFIDLFFALLYIFSRKGFFIFSAYIFLLIYFFLATYMTFLWGVENQPGLIFYILIIILSGVLISTRFSFLIMALESFLLYLFYYLQTKHLMIPDVSWKEPWHWKEVIVVTIIFGMIAAISWLSNRETEKSLKRARNSEAELKKERDLLEIKIQERTDELKKTQMEKMAQIYRFAEFGRLSSGFFHDLINPLTIVSLNMERVKDAQIKEIGEAKTYLGKAIEATRRLEDFIITARKQIKNQETKKIFSIPREIKQIIEMLSYKAKKANVKLNFQFNHEVELFGDSVKFSQAITNIVANAIDAYEGASEKFKNQECFVEIKLSENDNYTYLTIEDFGMGIEKANLANIFEPFFTTKDDNGIGIGLSLTKDIIEKDFKGGIKVLSELGKGTKFVLEFVRV